MPSIHSEPLRLGTNHMVGNSLYEPQRTNNFEVQIVGLTNLKGMGNTGNIVSNAGDVITLSTASYSAPQINMSNIPIRYGNNTVKYAGVPEFPDSTIVLNDYIGLEVEKILAAWFALVYDPTTEKIGYASEYKKTGYLIEYDTKGATARQWQINGCWISTLNLGEFNQEGGSVRQLNATLIYDNIIPA